MYKYAYSRPINSLFLMKKWQNMCRECQIQNMHNFFHSKDTVKALTSVSSILKELSNGIWYGNIWCTNMLTAGQSNLQQKPTNIFSEMSKFKHA